MRLRRDLRLACFAIAALLAVGGFVVPSEAQTGDDIDADRPASYLGFAYAAAVQIQGNTDPPQTVPELLRMDVPHGESTFGVGSLSRARASTAYPGGLGKLPNFFCTLGFPCDQFPGFPPQWPFNAEAEYPSSVDATPDAAIPPIGDGSNLEWTPVKANAHAGRDFADTDAASTDLRFIDISGGEGLTADTALIHVGSSQATTRQEFLDGVLVVTATSTLNDVDIAGQIHIDSLVTRSVSRADGGSIHNAEPEVLLQGVTLAGNPFEIGGDGVEIGGERQDQGTLPSITGGVGTLLQDGSVKVRLLSATRDLRNTAVADALGILVEYRIDASSFPGGTALIGNVLLGASRTSAVASQNDPFGPIDLDPAVTPPSPEPADSGPFDQVLGDTTDAFFPDSQPQPLTGGATSPSSPAPAPVLPAVPNTESVLTQPAPQPLEDLSGVVAERVTWFYAAGSIALLGLALGAAVPFGRAAAIPIPTRSSGS
ncbi:MAG TPA: hypothetical protein VGA13_11930 [Acidimicrobiales bacterium]|jgi:hypothetical protein